jgi:hypothetical protein
VILIVMELFIVRMVLTMGPGIVVGIVTHYRLHSPGIESRWEQDFPHQSRMVLGPNHPPIQWVLGLFPRGKAARVWPI